MVDVDEEYHGDTIIVEGDIEIDKPVESRTTNDVLNDVVRKNAKWPGGKVSYTFGNDDPCKILPAYVREMVHVAMTMWERSTPVTFVERESCDSHFIEFIITDKGVNYSAVGRKPTTKQAIGLRLDATIGNVLHELGHALGLLHTHSRNDRNKYVKVYSKDNNYSKYPEASEDVLGYDYQSIMHYPSIPEMKPVGGQSVGQRCYLSHGDIAAVTYLYGKETTTERLLFPQLTSVRLPGAYGVVEVFAQAVNNDVRKIIFTETECNVEFTDLSPHLRSGLSGAVTAGSVQLFAMKNANTVIRIQEKEGVWKEQQYCKLHDAVVGNVIPAHADDEGILLLFAQCADGSVIEIRGNEVKNRYTIPNSIKWPLNGSPMAVVANRIKTGRIDIFAIGSLNDCDGEVLTHVLHLTVSHELSSWKDLGRV